MNYEFLRTDHVILLPRKRSRRISGFKKNSGLLPRETSDLPDVCSLIGVKSF